MVRRHGGSPRPERPHRPLPEPTVRVRRSGATGPFTEADVRGIACNPIYAGLGPFPALVDDATWVATAARLIREEGAEQFLVNLLHVLRESLAGLELPQDPG